MTRGRNRWSRRAIRWLALIALLTAVAGPATQPATALQADQQYEMPQFDFEMEWDDPWVADQDTLETVIGVYDRFVVRNEETGAELEVVGAVGIEPETGLGSVVDRRVSEAGAEILSEDEGDGYVSATLAYDGPDGPTEEYVESSPVAGRDGGPNGALTLMVRAPAGDLELIWLLVQGTFVSNRTNGGPILLGVPMTSADPDTDAAATQTPGADETETPDAGPDGADAAIDGNRYTSPGFGYTLEWDQDLWEVNADQSGVADRDTLGLDYVDGGFLIVEGYEAYGGDPEECLDGSSAELLAADVVEDAEPLEDRRGDPVAGEEGDVVFAAYTVDLGTNVVVAYFTCQTLVEDEAVLAFSLIVPEDVIDDAIADLRDLQESLELDASATGRDQGTTRRPRLGGNETPTPRASQSDESYVSEDNGWSVEWDERDWSMGDEPGRGDDYELRLNSDFSTIDFTVYDDYDGDALECVDDQVSRIETGTFEEVEEIEAPGGDDELASAVYFVVFENSDGELVEVQSYIECRTLVPGETVLTIFVITAPEDYDDEIELVEDVLATIETPAARAA